MLRSCALALLALCALAPRARASPAPLDCCGDGTCALECTEGCAAAACAACCAGPLPDPCAGDPCTATECTDAGTCSGAGICSPETPKAAGATCTISTTGDGVCDGAGVCAPAAPAGSWVSISVSVTFGCGLDAARRAWCWGTNRKGALGQGADNAALTLPKRVVDPVAGTALFASVSSGGFHVCALTPAGAAYCWGARSTANCAPAAGALLAATSFLTPRRPAPRRRRRRRHPGPARDQLPGRHRHAHARVDLEHARDLGQGRRRLRAHLRDLRRRRDARLGVVLG